MSLDKSMLNAFDPSSDNTRWHQDRDLVERRHHVLGPAYRLFYEKPLHIVRGEGVWLYGHDGTRYLDAYNNVASVGHCHRHVVDAITRQAATLNTHTRYLHEGIVRYAERLVATFPDELSQAIFTCSGSEANDLALRIASRHTEGTGVIVTKLAYHGVTATVAAASPSLGDGVPLSGGVRTVAAPDGYRNLSSDVADQFAHGVRAAIADMRRHGIRPAALLVDTVFSSDGVYTTPAGFLAPAVAAIREAGGLFIADEVQAGFARTGSQMWGFQRHDVVPDLVTMGKPMGNGHPIAGLVAKPTLLAAFGREARYFNTFGGNPVSCAAAAATLDVIEQEGLQANANAIGTYLREGFRQLGERHALIGDIRGDGLFIGVELVNDRREKTPAPQATARFVNAMRDRGVLLSATGTHGNVIKLRPPLCFSRANAELLLQTADEALEALQPTSAV
ncbi:aspartate aminotransferase family protein (plasmid) [Burkholderia sp. FERM BP-3421]|uniref:aspartate aminotransferase family protein n=1 Tax=Burkholderia sp. FERM BP-3421 TaxID=1494466 RepID=UPI0023619607|nr:aspartate aminotransferase family protein [Burkholderia sp. FERM BP-3421]WDD90239.1 aspartate aminotransferase family protein [Burkholderia sp. FERM BP-3421]